MSCLSECVQELAPPTSCVCVCVWMPGAYLLKLCPNNSCVNVYMSVGLYACMCAHMYECMHVCIYMYAYVCVHEVIECCLLFHPLCVCVCVCVWIFSSLSCWAQGMKRLQSFQLPQGVPAPVNQALFPQSKRLLSNFSKGWLPLAAVPISIWMDPVSHSQHQSPQRLLASVYPLVSKLVFGTQTQHKPPKQISENPQKPNSNDLAQRELCYWDTGLKDRILSGWQKAPGTHIQGHGHPQNSPLNPKASSTSLPTNAREGHRQLAGFICNTFGPSERDLVLVLSPKGGLRCSLVTECWPSFARPWAVSLRLEGETLVKAECGQAQLQS
jgi:hypothetical protein